jgi:uncharacterized protein
MYYLIKAKDRPGTLERRQAARPAHLQRLQELQQQGRLLLAGPIPAIDHPNPGPAGFIGSLIIAEFDTRETAESWANSDPYVSAGVYEAVTVEPFRKVLP